jgi:hypothetical protein
MMTPHKILGLAVTGQSITAAEVAVSHGRFRLTHTAALPLPDGPMAQTPAQLGAALKTFLRQNRFSASRCVIGLGARWLVAKEKVLPPTAPDLVIGLLAIATEREFATGLEDLTFDFSGPAENPQGPAYLLVAAPRSDVDHLAAAADVAGLKVLAITSSMLCLTAATAARQLPRRLVLHLAPGGLELSVQSGGGVRLMRRLATSAPAGAEAGASPPDGWIDDLAGEVSRVIALLPGAETSRPMIDLCVWNGIGLSSATLDGLGRRLGITPQICKFPTDLGVEEAPAVPAGEFAAAAALAATRLGNRPIPVDFLHSRLQPRKKIALKGKLTWGGIAAGIVLVFGGILFWHWESNQLDLANAQAQLKQREESVAAAKDMVNKTTLARGWYDRRPKFLDCLAEITQTFPEEGRIWATSLAVGDDMRVLLSGKAADNGTVLEVLDRLRKADKKFSDVKQLYIRAVGDNTTDVSFAISLNFVKVEGS